MYAHAWVVATVNEQDGVFWVVLTDPKDTSPSVVAILEPANEEVAAILQAAARMRRMAILWCELRNPLALETGDGVMFGCAMMVATWAFLMW